MWTLEEGTQSSSITKEILIESFQHRALLEGNCIISTDGNYNHNYANFGIYCPGWRALEQLEFINV